MLACIEAVRETANPQRHKMSWASDACSITPHACWEQACAGVSSRLIKSFSNSLRVCTQAGSHALVRCKQKVIEKQFLWSVPIRSVLVSHSYTFPHLCMHGAALLGKMRSQRV